MIAPVKLRDVDPNKWFNRTQTMDPETVERARTIVDSVRDGGDDAVRQWTQSLDGVATTNLFLADAEWKQLADQCPSDIQHAILANLARIQAFHDLQVGGPQTLEVAAGVVLGRRPVPFQVAGCYVPGGQASYPSTVLMTVTLARLAGVPDIIVATPPRNDGTVDAAVAFAAKAAGASRILLAGGAQAIGALAYGTETVPKADCIVGPGNRFVTAAKSLVGHLVQLDAPAGPSELLVIADETANPEFIAADMVAQAEHDADAECILVTTSQSLADQVAGALQTQSKNATRAPIVKSSLESNGAILVCDTVGEAVEFANAYAAEHLEIQCIDAEAVANQILNAGSIFIGSHAPVPLGDYGSGTNHVLPTMGNARNQGGLSVDHFRKWVTWQNVSPQGLQAIGADVIALADAEGLHAHADAVRVRMGESK